MNDYHKLENDIWNNGFSHAYACWACNHRGFARMKKNERKRAKQKIKMQVRKQIKEELYE